MKVGSGHQAELCMSWSISTKLSKKTLYFVPLAKNSDELVFTQKKNPMLDGFAWLLSLQCWPSSFPALTPLGSGLSSSFSLPAMALRRDKYEKHVKLYWVETKQGGRKLFLGCKFLTRLFNKHIYIYIYILYIFIYKYLCTWKFVPLSSEDVIKRAAFLYKQSLRVSSLKGNVSDKFLKKTMKFQRMKWQSWRLRWMVFPLTLSCPKTQQAPQCAWHL